MRWTLEEDEQLRKLWDAREMAAFEIGETLKKTKNSVIGRAHRLGLEPKKIVRSLSKPLAKQRRREGVRNHELGIGSDKIKSVYFSERRSVWIDWPSTSDPVPFIQLEEHHCRSVEGKDQAGLAMYCGRHRIAIKRDNQVYYISSWCAEHAQRYYAPSSS